MDELKDLNEANTVEKIQKKPVKILFFGIIVGLLFSGFLFFFFFNSTNGTGFFSLSNNSKQQTPSQQTVTVLPLQEGTVDGFALLNPADFPVREQYFREVFRPRRESYNLFEKTAKFLGKDLEAVKQYFGLESEAEIFKALPLVPENFSEIAYLLSDGKYFSIGFLEEEYFLQPELYPNFKTIGVKYWTQPDPKYWVPHGYGSYPSEQFDTLELGKREEFTAAVFVHTGWGVQSFQGMSLDVDSESKKLFDIEIYPKNFLLTPVFPKFTEKWAYKILIKGKLKQNTSSGSYKIGINVLSPPSELVEQWTFVHKNLYFNAAGTIRPSGNFIELNITVKE